MKILCSVHPRMEHVEQDVRVVQWERGDPVPVFGAPVGVDTETELITDTCLDPPLVVLGVYDPSVRTCYIVYWEDIGDFFRGLCGQATEQRYFNLGFDEQVLDNELEEKPLLKAIDSDHVIDMQIRIHLNELATIGFIRHNLYSLEGCVKEFLNWQLDKGDGTEDSHRLSFRRGTPITTEQAEYLAYDCMTTWALGEAVKHQATEEAHTKGMVVLAHISTNGMTVDPVMYKYFRDKLQTDMDHYREELVAIGFPDPYRDPQREANDIQDLFFKQYDRLLARGGLKSGLYFHVNPEMSDHVMPSKTNLRYAICYLYEFDDDSENLHLLPDYLKTVMEWDRKNMLKKAADEYAMLCEEYGIQSVDELTKAVAMQAYVAKLMEYVNDTLDKTDKYLFKDAVEYADKYLDEHPSLCSTVAPIGPRKYFQDHVARLLKQNPGLELDRTEKSGEIKLTLKDMWKLEDMGITDKFLQLYTSFQHCQKYMSTYMDPKFIKSDGKVHPRYTNILRTGRTSCNSPNCQQLPSRDATYPLKLIYRAPEGAVLCATDYSHIELNAFGQACYTRFGYSVMRDVINAGLDPHRWFAGVMTKVIDPDLSKANDPQWVKQMTEFLNEHVSKSARQNAKMANFGLPGLMGCASFFKHCREEGLKITKKETDAMREAWISTFKEMEDHTKPVPAPKQRNTFRRQMGMDADDEEEFFSDADSDKRLYIARCINGFVRNNCSANAACNAQFQAVVAFGAKLGGWNLLYHLGMGDRFIAFIHDEYLYWLMPDELDIWIPRVEAEMVAGMKVAIPDVDVEVETTCSYHWDKSKCAKEFHKLDKDENGLYIINEPDMVLEAYGRLGEHKQE